MSDERVATADALDDIDTLFRVTDAHFSRHEKNIVIKTFIDLYRDFKVGIHNQNPENFIRVLQDDVTQITYFASLKKEGQLLGNEEALLIALGHVYAAILASIDWYLSLEYRYVQQNTPLLAQDLLVFYRQLKVQLDILGKGPETAQVARHAQKYAHEFNVNTHIDQRKFLADATKLFR